jgi:amino acid adenylation domain-containing protein
MKLTLPQQDVYFEQLLYPNEPIYNIGAKIEIRGDIDIEIFNKAYIALIDQHDAYRTVLVRKGENIKVKLIDDHQSELGFVDFSQKENSKEEANLYMHKEFTKPFDIFNSDLLHTFILVKVSQNFYYLFSVYHHIITDGWGTSLMFQRLVQNYNEIFEYGKVQTNYPFSYKNFALEDEQYQNSESFGKDRQYWTLKFESLPESLFSRVDDTFKINKSKRKELVLKRILYNQLNIVSKEYGSSTFHLILATLYLYFGRKHQNKDFAIGLPVLNRNKKIHKNTVGLFMGISPLRIQLDFETTFKDLVRGIKNQLRKDYRHQRFPLGKLIQELQIFQEKEKLFNITLSYEKQNYSNNFLNTQTQVVPMTHESERVALAIYIREFDEKEDVKIDFDYNINYFDEFTITQIVNHFEHLIKEILSHPNKKLKELNYLLPKEKNLLLKQFNNTVVDYPKDKTVIGLFSEQVTKTPDHVAIQGNSSRYTYAELAKLSDQIASYLITTYGEEDRSPVTLLLDRSSLMVAVLLAVMKSGRPYIPMDPTFPKDRLYYILKHSQSSLMISEKNYAIMDSDEVSILEIENILEKMTASTAILSNTISSDDTAYIIYTSGSTGNPKGVEIGHRSLLNFLIGMQQTPGVDSTDIFFSVTTYSFDISILEFFTPLISGGQLYVASQDLLTEPDQIIKEITEVGATIIQATPSFYQMLFNAKWQGDKGLKVLCGGDLLSESLAGRLVDSNQEVWNMYGPTETTIWSSIKKIERSKDASNIGKPIQNTQFYIVDDFLNPMPLGAIGSIYIGGDGLAKGYYHDDKLTKQKFSNNPFIEEGLIYETGDIGRWDEQGEIVFSGRNDNQVKIRGYRIELGDIETKLNQVAQIKNAVVIAKKKQEQEAFLVAFVLTENEQLNIEDVLNDLKNELPEYMIPYTIIRLEKFPLTPNQKLDRKALMQRSIHRDINKNDFKAPNNDLEIKLSEYWKSLLHIDRELSVTDNFFTLGGHSLNAVKLVGLVNKNFSSKISLKTIFDYPTIESLSQYLQKLTPNYSDIIPISKSKDFYPLTPSQYNIWLASQKENISIAYNMSSAYNIDGIVNADKLVTAIRKIIEKYEILRTNFVEINGVPYQKIKPIETVDFDILVEELKDEKINTSIHQFINTAFDLEKDLLIRIKLFQLQQKKYILVFYTHHTVMDGWSLEVFIKEFIENYNVSLTADISAKDDLKLQFKDYAIWHNEFIENKATDNESFWNQYLKNYQFKHSFQRDFEIKNDQHRGERYELELSQETASSLKNLASKEKTTLHTVLVTALNCLIYKFSGHNDICLGTINSGRNMPELNTQIGMFVKTLILRTQIDSEISFFDLLKNVQNDLLTLDSHQDMSFDKLKTSFFDIILVYQNPEFSYGNINELTDFKLTSYPINEKYSRIPILFNFFESDNKLNTMVIYNPEMYQKETIQIITLKFFKILDEIIKKPSTSVKAIDILLELETVKTIDFDFNF